MAMIEILQTYFRGEKLEALWFILPVGAALVAFGAVLLKAERTGFAWGAAIPAIVFGLVFMATGAVVGARTTGQVAELKSSFERDPGATVQHELPRMQKVNANFRSTFIAFGVAVLLGLGLIYAVRSEWAQGLGSVLILAGGLGLLIDGVASRRAVPYTAALEAIAEQHGSPSRDRSRLPGR